MKVLLINPPPRIKEHSSIMVPPLGLLYIGTVLKRAGHDVIVKDAFAEQLSFQELEKYIRQQKAEVIGLSGMTPTIDTNFRAISIARAHTSYIIMGGPHASAFRHEIFEQCRDVDYVILGEGELTILELISALENGSDIQGIAGVISKTIRNEERPFISDLDSIPFPNRSLLNNNLYNYPFSKHRNVTTIFSSRGCPYNCIFCDKSVFGSKWRARSSRSILEEVDDIVGRHKIRSIIFYDDLFTLDKNRVHEICEGLIRRDYKLDWKCEGRVNLTDPETLKLMKRAGCSMIAYGVESGNKAGLDYLKKKTNPDQALRAFEMTKKAGIKTMAYFIMGIPSETFEDALNTVEFAKKLKADYAQFSILSPFYGTECYDIALSNGWLGYIDAKNPMDKDLKKPAVLSPNWPERDLEKILHEAHKKFYFSFSYLMKFAFSWRNFQQYKNALRIFVRMISWIKNIKLKR